MLEIVFSDHFILRQRLRQIPDELAESIYLEAEEHYSDSQTGTLVAVKRLFFHGRMRDVALVYAQRQGKIVLITLHPLQEGQKEKRIRSGRWVTL